MSQLSPYEAVSRDVRRIYASTLTYRSEWTVYVHILHHEGHITLQCDPEMTVERLLSIIADGEGVDVNSCRFAYQCRPLINDGRTLRERGFEDESNVFVITHRLGGGGPAPPGGFSFSDVSNTKSVRKTGFSESARRGCATHAGMSVACSLPTSA
jgi:hypothetical protein